jgi:hypothetical protein
LAPPGRNGQDGHSQLYLDILDCQSTWEALTHSGYWTGEERIGEEPWLNITIIEINENEDTEHGMGITHPKNSNIVLRGYLRGTSRERIATKLMRAKTLFVLTAVFPTDTGPNAVYVAEEALEQLSEDERLDLTAMEIP